MMMEGLSQAKAGKGVSLDDAFSATLQSPTNTKAWLGRMKEELASLTSMPERIPLTEEEP